MIQGFLRWPSSEIPDKDDFKYFADKRNYQSRLTWYGPTNTGRPVVSHFLKAATLRKNDNLFYYLIKANGGNWSSPIELYVKDAEHEY